MNSALRNDVFMYVIYVCFSNADRVLLAIVLLINFQEDKL